jgi:hypothetical protein
MKTGDFYNHYKGTEYYFDCIALPLEDRKKVEPILTVRHHENTHDIQLYICESGVTFIDSDVPHVIYQSEKDYNTNKVWAREVDDFFDTVTTIADGLVKRFTLKK